MDFSIILPSREREILLLKLLLSINDTTEDLDRIEVLIAVDDDDTIDYEKKMGHLSFVKFFRVRRSLNFSKDYYNFLASKSSGKWIICCNDDAVFETQCWDSTCRGILENQSNIVYGFIEDGMDNFRVKAHAPYCSFPLQGRGGYEALGYIFPDRIEIWGANLWVKYLYEQLGSVVKLPILIHHYTHHNKTRDRDHISDRIASNQGIYRHPKPTRAEFEKLVKLYKPHDLRGVSHR